MIAFIIKLCIIMISVIYYTWPIEMHVYVSHLVHKQLELKGFRTSAIVQILKNLKIKKNVLEIGSVMFLSSNSLESG
jgi:hypothetical protein